MSRRSPNPRGPTPWLSVRPIRRLSRPLSDHYPGRTARQHLRERWDGVPPFCGCCTRRLPEMASVDAVDQIEQRGCARALAEPVLTDEQASGECRVEVGGVGIDAVSLVAVIRGGSLGNLEASQVVASRRGESAEPVVAAAATFWAEAWSTPRANASSSTSRLRYVPTEARLMRGGTKPVVRSGLGARSRRPPRRGRGHRAPSAGSVTRQTRMPDCEAAMTGMLGPTGGSGGLSFPGGRKRSRCLSGVRVSFGSYSDVHAPCRQIAAASRPD